MAKVLRPLTLIRGCTFSAEIVGYLYEHSLPLLKEKLDKKMEKKSSQIQTPSAPKQDFLFKDIFHCDDDSDEGGSEEPR